jgi:multiple antibiotic resistance protein
MSPQEAITQFVTLFVVIDPAATMPLYLLTVRGLSRARARQIAVIAAVMAFVVLLFFVAFFELLLEAMQVPLSSFQLAGSIVLLIYGLQLVFEQLKTDDSADVATTEGLMARAAYPLAIPGLAGPGSMMTVTLLTENYHRSLVQQAQTIGIVAICLGVIVLIFFAAEPVHRVIGRGGLGTMSRVMGLILSSIAVTNGVKAIKVVFGLN